MPLTILLVEDNSMVWGVVQETLELEGRRVEGCADGGAALRLIESGRHYDLLLLDNDLTGVSGLELIRQARQLAHRRQTPIIMLSAGLYRAEGPPRRRGRFFEQAGGHVRDSGDRDTPAHRRGLPSDLAADLWHGRQAAILRQA